MIGHLIDPNKIRILPDFEDILPSLTAEEKKNLEENLTNGFDPTVGKIIVWYEPGNDIPVIVDGHNRYNICREKGIQLTRNCFTEKTFPDKDSVIRWIIQGQLSRRNLTDVQKVEIVNKYKSILRAQGKVNMAKGGKGSTISSKVNTRKELAKAAGMSEGKYAETTTVLNSDDEETKRRLKNGEISVHKAAQIVKEKKQVKVKSSEEVIHEIDHEMDHLKKQSDNINNQITALKKKRLAEFSKIESEMKYTLLFEGYICVNMTAGNLTQTLYEGTIRTEIPTYEMDNCPKDREKEFRTLWKEAFIKSERLKEENARRAKRDEEDLRKIIRNLSGETSLEDIPLNFRKKCGRAIIKEFHDNPKYSTQENQWAIMISKYLEAI